MCHVVLSAEVPAAESQMPTPHAAGEQSAYLCFDESGRLRQVVFADAPDKALAEFAKWCGYKVRPVSAESLSTAYRFRHPRAVRAAADFIGTVAKEAFAEGIDIDALLDIMRLRPEDEPTSAVA
jgi:hypothetical protein